MLSVIQRSAVVAYDKVTREPACIGRRKLLRLIFLIRCIAVRPPYRWAMPSYLPTRCRFSIAESACNPKPKGGRSEHC